MVCPQELINIGFLDLNRFSRHFPQLHIWYVGVLRDHFEDTIDQHILWIHLKMCLNIRLAKNSFDYQKHILDYHYLTILSCPLFRIFPFFWVVFKDFYLFHFVLLAFQKRAFFNSKEDRLKNLRPYENCQSPNCANTPIWLTAMKLKSVLSFLNTQSSTERFYIKSLTLILTHYMGTS